MIDRKFVKIMEEDMYQYCLKLPFQKSFYQKDTDNVFDKLHKPFSPVQKILQRGKDISAPASAP